MYNDNTNTTDDTPEMEMMRRRLEYKREGARRAVEATERLHREQMGSYKWSPYLVGLTPSTPHH